VRARAQPVQARPVRAQEPLEQVQVQVQPAVAPRLLASQLAALAPALLEPRRLVHIAIRFLVAFLRPKAWALARRPRSPF
jgi:hypothetical protein